MIRTLKPREAKRINIDRVRYRKRAAGRASRLVGARSVPAASRYPSIRYRIRT
ncbi:MAG: hypothetical protein ACK5Q5_04060 [Planctomycetaceae bacterium]